MGSLEKTGKTMSETGLVFDIQRASLHDGPGIRTTVFLKGCPLNCLWCHNPEANTFSRQLFFYYEKCARCGDCAAVCPEAVHHVSPETHEIDFEKCNFCGKCVEECPQNALKIVGAEMSVEDVLGEVRADQDFYAYSGGGITLSGGEPLAQFPFSMELLKQCQELGIHTCLETSGYAPQKQLLKILAYVDLLLLDYKITGAEAHQKYTGVSNETILANLDAAYQAGTPIILRCPIIPSINDTAEHFQAIYDLEKKYPGLQGIEILPYHDMGNNKRTSIGVEKTLADLKSTPPDTSAEWLQQLKKLGCEKVKIG
jgi:glycyl-radical enzyme activating protein